MTGVQTCGSSDLPLGRIAATPLEAYTVVDIVRSTLGIGPCEYVLDLEGQQSRSKGRATCSNRDTLNPIYEHKQQKAKRADVDKSLTDVMTFIRYIRERIEGYVAFSHEIATYLAEQKKSHPELAKELDELSSLAAMVDQKLAARKDKIQTPDQAQAIVDEFRRKGMDARTAVIEGGRRRLRPILMTAVATILALIPMALGIGGKGGFLSTPLAVVVIGGLFTSTFLTLILVPVLYLALDRLRPKRATVESDESWAQVPVTD